ncbi:MAG: hypothetical protein EOO38_32960 [Cytophagaceae bacterium]|nr:MAG: hypothetical protein EOO38_32960 [Cytophagaceae bacterium]
MCGLFTFRYTLAELPKVQQVFFELADRFKIAPSQNVAAVLPVPLQRFVCLTDALFVNIAVIIQIYLGFSKKKADVIEQF